jgi:DNA-directed RNA polymerase subunit H
MHILQPKHSILKKDDAEKLLVKYNVSISQLPKMKITDPAIPKDTQIGDVVKIERKDENKTVVYYRVVVV